MRAVHLVVYQMSNHPSQSTWILISCFPAASQTNGSLKVGANQPREQNLDCTGRGFACKCMQEAEARWTFSHRRVAPSVSDCRWQVFTPLHRTPVDAVHNVQWHPVTSGPVSGLLCPHGQSPKSVLGPSLSLISSRCDKSGGTRFV